MLTICRLPLAIEPVPSVPIREIRGGKKRFVLISADSWTQKISVQIREIRGEQKKISADSCLSVD